MSDTPPLFWEVIVAGKAMHYDFRWALNDAPPVSNMGSSVPSMVGECTAANASFLDTPHALISARPICTKVSTSSTPSFCSLMTVLAGHNSPVMLRDLLEFLTTSGGDAALIKVVRARLNTVTASN
ncbi:hypothetical protein B0H16DRAFT_1468341 [Mycena metata]|uniref:Uncharacterized protein n=1 Tax=Mycena metata TaxID=1033252 RepID=A0AAD7I1E2_9AGAR|nr:hypothetical protein B0H16DRAFT_1468341 [Mycena metata]